MKCQIITQTDPLMEKYEEFIRCHKNAHFLQSPAWAEVKPQWQWYAIVVFHNSGEIAGGMSVLIRKLPLNFSIAYAPRGPVCNRNSKTVLSQLVTGLKEFAKWNRCLLTYIDPDENDDNHIFSGIMTKLGFVTKKKHSFVGIQPYNVFRLPLKDMEADELLSGFAAKTRYNIRLAQRYGVTIHRYSGGLPHTGSSTDRILYSYERDRGKRPLFCPKSALFFQAFNSYEK